MKPKKKSRKQAKIKTTGVKHLSNASPKKLSPTKTNSQGRVITKRRQYSLSALNAALEAVQTSTISVHAASKQFGVPLTTLRDRVDGRVDKTVTRPGPSALFSQEEEAQIVRLMKTMRKYGYRYTHVEIADIATDYAVTLGKRKETDNKLTLKWVINFTNRWPVVKELGCKHKRREDPEETIRTYFEEVKKITDRYKLLQKTHRIFNIMEIPLTTNHSSPSLTSGLQFKTENVTTTTVIAAGSVSGQVLPPFLVYQACFLRARMMSDLPDDVNIALSDSGSSSPHIFRRYLREHFLPHVERSADEPILVLMDGLKSHMFVGLGEWGKENNVIFSFVPALATHYLQPLQVQCYENFIHAHANVCTQLLKSLDGRGISRYSVGQLACKAYEMTFTEDSLVCSFKKAGILPELSSDESEEEEDDDSSFSSARSSNSFGQNEPALVKEEAEDDTSTVEAQACEEVAPSDFTGSRLSKEEPPDDFQGDKLSRPVPEQLSTASEVVLSSDGQTQGMVVMPDGQLMFSPGDSLFSLMGQDGQLPIQDATNMFLGSEASDLPQLSLVIQDGSPKTHSTSSPEAGSSGRTSGKKKSGKGRTAAPKEVSHSARTLPMEDLIMREKMSSGFW